MGSASYSYRQALTQGQGLSLRTHGTLPETIQLLKTSQAPGQSGPGEPHPFMKIDGERFPPGCFRNVDGFLVRGQASFTVLGEDLGVLGEEIRFLRDHVLIARTLTRNLTSEAEAHWIFTLRQHASPGTVLGQQVQVSFMFD